MRYLTVVLVGLLLGGTTVPAAQDALLRKLVEKGVLTPAEADQLQAEVKKEQVALEQSLDKVKVNSWIDSMTWSGDFRLRYLSNAYEDSLDLANRQQFQIRFRLGVDIKFAQWALVGLRVATGPESPVSTNQSMEDTFSKKSIRLDRVFLALQPPQLDWLKVVVGKMPNPFWVTAVDNILEWDPDVSPEGAAEQFNFKFGDKQQNRLFANFGQFVLEELQFDSNDPYMFDFQAGAESKLGPVTLTGAGGFYFTKNVDQLGIEASSQPTGSAVPAGQSSSKNRGNATRQPGGAGTTLYYLDDFEVAYARAQVGWTISPKPFLGTPALVLVSAEYLQNLASAYENLTGSTQTANPDQTEGYVVQVAFGDSKKKGQWRLGYLYKYLEADATWDAISDSDWGNGGTDRKGHLVKAIYNLQDWWQLVFTASWTEKISDRPNSGNNTRGQSGEEMLRLQVDTIVAF